MMRLHLRRTIRPTLSQLLSTKIRRKTFLNYMKFADLLIIEIKNYEKGYRALSCL